MNRIIKFRGRRVLHPQEFVYGDYEPTDSEVSFIHLPKTTHHVAVDTETVGQFTGIYDSTGKEIYEGDIVEASYEQLTMKDGIVQWDKATARFIIKSPNSSIFFKFSADSETLIDTIKVTGNIYEK